MAYIQRNTPPPNRIHSFSMQNFTGGLNNREEVLQDNEASDLLNLAFSNDTVMEKRKGSKLHELQAPGFDRPITHINEYAPYTGQSWLLCSGDGDTHFLREDGMVYSSIWRNPGGVVDSVNASGKLFYTFDYGLFAWGAFNVPESTYVRNIGTSFGDDEYIRYKVVTPPITYVPLDETHTQGVTVYDHDEFKVWYEPCTNELEDPYLGANVIPDSAQYIEYYNGRLFISGVQDDKNNVFISELRNPYYFPVALPIQLPPNPDKVVGLHLYDDSLLVGRTKDIYTIEGLTNRPDIQGEKFYLRRVNTHTGWANGRAVSKANNFLFYLGSDGVAYSMSAIHRDSRLISTEILSRKIDLFEEPLGFTLDDLPNAHAYFHDDKWYLSINDKVLIYSYRTHAWTVYDGLNARSFIFFNNQLMWGNDDGKLVTWSDDYLDQGAPYRAFWQSKNFDMDNASYFKHFRDFFIVSHTYDSYRSDVRVTFELDYNDVRGNMAIDNQLSIWGQSLFGSRFRTRNIHASQPFTLGQRGRMMRYRLANGYAPSGEVATYDDLLSITPPVRNGAYYVTDEASWYTWDGEWRKLELEDYDQPMKILQVNGDYELRGKR